MNRADAHRIDCTDDANDGRIPTWRIEELTKGGYEARILHDGSVYRLRITSNRKLILTK